SGPSTRKPIVRVRDLRRGRDRGTSQLQSGGRSGNAMLDAVRFRVRTGDARKLDFWNSITSSHMQTVVRQLRTMCSCAVAHIILMKPNGGSDRCSREKSLRIIHAATGFRSEWVRRHGDDGWLRMARVGSASNTIDMQVD